MKTFAFSLATLALILPGMASAQGALSDADRAAWSNVEPGGQVIKRTTDRYPLSD